MKRYLLEDGDLRMPEGLEQLALLSRLMVSPSKACVKVEAIATVVQPRMSAGEPWSEGGQ